MKSIFRKLKLLFRPGQLERTDETALNEAMGREAIHLQTVDPETDQQWLRLQQAITRRGPKAAPRRREWAPRLALGAAAVVLALVGALWYFSLQSASEKFITGKGEQRELLLEDGSQVTLSYATTLDVPGVGDGSERRISLSGEAYFRVRPGGNRFIVSTELAEVKVVGTEFNVRVREGILEVSVMSGTVDVSASRDGTEKTLRLLRFQRATWSQNDFPKEIGDIPSSDYPGWMHGKLFLGRTAFSQACEEIEMRFNVKIRLEDPQLRSDVVTGFLEAKTASSAVIALCALTGREFKRDGQEYIIY